MNREIREVLDNNNYFVKKITIKGNTKIVDDGKTKLVIKRKNEADINNLYKYLLSRSFDYFPKIVYSSDNYNFYEYINDSDEPFEQKILDIIYLMSVLHIKTTFYKNIDSNDYKYLYEEVINQANYLENYYNDITSLIERNEFMSPSSYLLIRNISKVFENINYSRYSIEKWYNIISEKKRVRIVQLHNNLSNEHFLKNKKSYFISWNKSKRDMPIYDLLNIFNKYYYEIDFCDLLGIYEKNYQLLPEEKYLLFSLISLPNKLMLSGSEYQKCLSVKKFYDKLYAAFVVISEYMPKEKISK